MRDTDLEISSIYALPLIEPFIPLKDLKQSVLQTENLSAGRQILRDYWLELCFWLRALLNTRNCHLYRKRIARFVVIRLKFSSRISWTSEAWIIQKISSFDLLRHSDSWCNFFLLLSCENLHINFSCVLAILKFIHRF